MELSSQKKWLDNFLNFFQGEKDCHTEKGLTFVLKDLID